MLLLLVPTVLDEPPSRVHQKVEAAVRMPIHLVVHMSHRSGQAWKLLESTHQRAVEVRLRGFRIESEHESVLRVHEGLLVLVLAAEGHAFKMSIGDMVGRGVVALELLLSHSQCLTARQEIKKRIDRR